MRVVTLKAPESFLEELDRYALTHGLTRSDVIRDAVIHYIRRDGHGRPKRWVVKRVVLS